MIEVLGPEKLAVEGVRNMKRLALVGCVWFSSVVALSSSALAANVAGAVHTADNKPVTDVRIVVKSYDFGTVRSAAYNPSTPETVTRETVTDSRGNYSIGGLPEGDYVFTLEPRAKGIQRGDGVGNVGKDGLTVDWTVSPNAPALAMATPGVTTLAQAAGGGAAGGAVGGAGGAGAAGAGAAGAGLGGLGAVGVAGGITAGVTGGVLGGLAASGGIGGGGPATP